MLINAQQEARAPVHMLTAPPSEPALVTAARAAHPECRFSSEFSSTRSFRAGAPAVAKNEAVFFMHCPGRPRELLARISDESADAASEAAAPLGGIDLYAFGGLDKSAALEALERFGRAVGGPALPPLPAAAAAAAASAASAPPRSTKSGGIYI